MEADTSRQLRRGTGAGLLYASAINPAFTHRSRLCPNQPCSVQSPAGNRPPGRTATEALRVRGGDQGQNLYTFVTRIASGLVLPAHRMLCVFVFQAQTPQ